jgi:serine/threonine-protein kinase
VERALGKGGMGEVFAAENIRTGRAVALKVLRAEAKAKASAIERFRREARAAGSIRSDHVTQVLDVEDDPEHGIVLVFELLEGESLVDRLKRTGPLTFEELWPVVESVWIGLSDAHAAGVVHRDLKPSNVYLQRSHGGMLGRVKILDFGISKLPKKITTQSLTQVGQSLGTFSFMPPEQIGKAKMVDHRADIYACTTLIYQALSGQLPYQAKNVVAMMELKSRTEPRTLGEALGRPVDQALEDFIARGLTRNPDERFQTAVEALEAWRKLRPPGVKSAYDTPSLTDDDGEDAASRAKTQVRPMSEVMPLLSSTADTASSTDRFVRTPQMRAAAQQAAQAGNVGADGAAAGPAVPPTQDDDEPVIETAPHGMNVAELVGTHPSAVSGPPAAPADPASHLAPPGGSVAVVPAPPASGAAPGAPLATGFDGRGSDMHLEAVPFDPQASDMHLEAVPFDPQASDMHLEAVPAFAPAPPPTSRARVAIGLILGALVLMLLGFGIVALAIRLLR